MKKLILILTLAIATSAFAQEPTRPMRPAYGIIGGDFGPMLPYGWHIIAVIDYNNDGVPDWVLENEYTGETAVWLISLPHHCPECE